MSEKLVNAIAEMDDELAIALSKEMLAQGGEPIEILNDCRTAMEVVGKRFEIGRVLHLRADPGRRDAQGHLGRGQTPAPAGRPSRKPGRSCWARSRATSTTSPRTSWPSCWTSTALRSKTWASMCRWRASWPKSQTWQPDVVALSGFLTLAYTSMKETVEAIEAAGLRGQVKIMVGGGTVDAQVCSYARADGWGIDAMTAVSLAKQWTAAA